MKKIVVLALVASVVGMASIVACGGDSKPANDPAAAAGTAMPSTDVSATPASTAAPASTAK